MQVGNHLEIETCFHCQPINHLCPPKKTHTNSADPDQILQNVASDQSILRLHKTYSSLCKNDELIKPDTPEMINGLLQFI